MCKIGFRPYLSPAVQAPIITAFYYPEHPNFVLEDFYGHLSTKGFIIYPGKLSEVDCFRIGNIGRLGTADMEALLAAVRETLQDMQIML
jgi:2-aminoethylphosphonate-pyruvate transaminase